MREYGPRLNRWWCRVFAKATTMPCTHDCCAQAWENERYVPITGLRVIPS